MQTADLRRAGAEGGVSLNGLPYSNDMLAHFEKLDFKERSG